MTSHIPCDEKFSWLRISCTHSSWIQMRDFCWQEALFNRRNTRVTEADDIFSDNAERIISPRRQSNALKGAVLMCRLYSFSCVRVPSIRVERSVVLYEVISYWRIIVICRSPVQLHYAAITFRYCHFRWRIGKICTLHITICIYTI